MSARNLVTGTLDFRTLTTIGSFLVQAMGVVNLNWFVRERLAIFTFAGEDGVLSREETARREVWHALLAKRVYEHFGLRMFLVVMLGFDDYDFQRLVLDPVGCKRNLPSSSGASVIGLMHPAPLCEDSRNEPHGPRGDALSERHAHIFSVVPTPYADSDSGECDLTRECSHYLIRCIQNKHAEQDPAKLARLDALLHEYRTREMDLVQELARKYQLDAIETSGRAATTGRGVEARTIGCCARPSTVPNLLLFLCGRMPRSYEPSSTSNCNQL